MNVRCALSNINYESFHILPILPHLYESYSIFYLNSSSSYALLDSLYNVVY